MIDKQDGFELGRLYSWATSGHWAEIWASDWEMYVGTKFGPNDTGPDSAEEADEMIMQLRDKIKEAGIRT
jgi:hypothetical protein